MMVENEQSSVGGWITLPKIRWIRELNQWEEPENIRVAIGDIVNWSSWHFRDARQKQATPFEVTKVILRSPLRRPSEGEEPHQNGMLIVALSPSQLDAVLGPLKLQTTYRPYGKA